MLIKVNRDLDFKLSTIARRSNMKNDIMMKRMMEAFIERYEAKKGKIVTQVKKNSSETFIMYRIFKTYYFQYFNKEYITDLKGEKIDLYNLKLMKNKIMRAILEHEQQEIVVVNDQDFLNAFEFILSKTPKWWIDRAFTPPGLNKHCEKILSNIKNGRKSGKDALDDFISGLS